MDNQSSQEGPHSIRYLLDLYYAVEKALAPNTDPKPDSESKDSDRPFPKKPRSLF